MNNELGCVGRCGCRLGRLRDWFPRMSWVDWFTSVCALVVLCVLPLSVREYVQARRLRREIEQYWGTERDGEKR